MSENPMKGRPYGGRSEPPEDADLPPGERPLSEDEQRQQPPAEPDHPTGQSTRAARGGPMAGADGEGGGVPGSATGPSSAGPPDAGTSESTEPSSDEDGRTA